MSKKSRRISGQEIRVKVPDDMLKAIDTRRGEHSRSQYLRLMVSVGMHTVKRPEELREW